MRQEIIDHITPRHSKNSMVREPHHDKNHAGVSLIISIFFVSAFMLMIADEAQIILARIRTDANWLGSDKAFYLNESVEEVANFYSAAHGVGANWDSEAARITNSSNADLLTYITPIESLAQEIGVSSCGGGQGQTPCVDFKIKGRAEDTDKINISSGTSAYNGSYHSVPIINTGSAAETCDNATNADDECNWNKIELGESVQIPLYYEDANGAPQKLDVSGTNKFLLRVRTPLCDTDQLTVGGQCDSSTQRILLYPKSVNTSDFRDINKDPVLIQWIISDEGGDNSMIASDAKISRSNKRLKLDNITDAGLNTELTAGRINEAGNSGGGLFDFVTLDGTQKGTNILTNKDGLVSDFLSKSEIKKPVLRLNLVERPRIANCATTPLTNSTYSDLDYKKFVNDSNCNVPYLEYQLLTTDGNLSDTKRNLEGYAIVGDFKKRFKSNIPLPVSAGGFAMESF